MARLLLALLLGLLPIYAVAEKVIPRDSVRNFVNVRETPSSPDAIHQLRPGDMLDYVISISGWHEVIIPDGRHGFVSKRWTLVVPDPVGAEFGVHFIDVGTGDSAVIDVGDTEIIIDGGNFSTSLTGYIQKHDLIQGPIELVVVTHGDTDHWKGLNRLLGFDGVEDNPPAVLEFWDAGYDRDCNPASSGGRQSYLQFIQRMEAHATTVRRPLEDHHTPAVVSGNPQSFEFPPGSGVNITVLHSDSTPPATSGCSYQVNNASIVLKVEIDGLTFLFTGDANGKERDEASPATPGHVEQQLLALEAAHEGTLKADVLKVPHHGSETASTQAFINAVDPDFVIISASTIHHLPRQSVVDRYDNGQRVILRTDVHRPHRTDPIVCTRVEGQLTCNFADAFVGE